MLLPLPKNVIYSVKLKYIIEKEYIARVETEHRYFEFVNTIRLLSRQLFTQVSTENPLAARQIHEILLEIRKKLLNFNENFSSRFLNEELRSLEFYEDGSALRQMATIKELFATHIALLWTASKHLRGSLQDKTIKPSEVEKLQFVEKTIKGLLNSDHLMNEIKLIASDEEKSQNEVTNMSSAALRKLLDSFDADQSPAQDTAKLQKLQQIYAIVHEHFAEKAGNRGIIHELAEDENEVLFRKESKAAGNNQFEARFLNKSKDGGDRQGKYGLKPFPNKRDIMMGAAGDDHDDKNDQLSIEDQRKD